MFLEKRTELAGVDLGVHACRDPEEVEGVVGGHALCAVLMGV